MTVMLLDHNFKIISIENILSNEYISLQMSGKFF